MAKKQDKATQESILEVSDSTKETEQPTPVEDSKEATPEETVEVSAEEVKVEAPESTEEVKTEEVETIEPEVEEHKVETTPAVETEKTPEATTEDTTETKPSELKEGGKVTFKAPKVRLFEKSHSAKCAKATDSCQYFVWDSEVINNRVRVTECANSLGEISKIAGWVEVSDIETK